MKTITLNNEEYVSKAAYDTLNSESAKLPTISKETAPYELNKTYLIRTVTHTYTGVLVWVGDKELVLENPAWIADSGRWMQAVKEGILSEVEPMNERAIIGRGAIVDASVVTWKAPTEQK